MMMEWFENGVKTSIKRLQKLGNINLSNLSS